MEQKSVILIVDDDEINRDILRIILKEEYDILEAADGAEALDLLARHTQEIEGIIVDLIMPGMDGFEFLRHYAKREEWKDIPVIVATGDERSQTESRCLEMGAWDVVHKPFNAPVVFLRLKNNISRRRLMLLEKQKITSLFQRYVDPSVLEELLQNDISEQTLRGRTVEVAVLFVDIRGFTAMAERFPPETVVEFLDECLTMMGRAVMRHGGTLDKFVGDCTMAFWGAPLPCEEKELSACLAALDIMRETEALSLSLRKRFGCGVTFGAGIHTGPAVVGNIGMPDRMDYTAIGDTVNTASRLESSAPPGCIYISRAVADRLGTRAEAVSLGTQPLKGKKSGFEVLELKSAE